MYFDSNVIKVLSYEFNWQEVITDWGIGLALYRPQAITWTNDDSVHRHTYASSGLKEISDCDRMISVCDLMASYGTRHLSHH